MPVCCDTSLPALPSRVCMGLGHRWLRQLAVSGAWLVAAAAFSALSAHAAPGLPSTNVAWIPAAVDADVDRAFAQARAERKPVLLYWGATWCPPCNQLKATLFNRQDFAAQARNVVAVHVDGDRPGAQKLGARFKVRGYPTVILMGADGAEISRLPGEADAPQVLALLQAGLSGGRPIKAVLADARAGKSLTPGEWRMLAFHGWEVDEEQLAPAAERPNLLAELARRSEASSNGRDSETSTRLWLKALAASDDGKGLKPEPAQRELVLRVLADPSQSRLHMDVLSNEAPDIVQVLSTEGSAERATLLARFEAALTRLQADATLSRGDRLSALVARVRLARLGQGKDTVQPRLPEALVREVRETAARLDREITDGYERQAVITSAAWLLGQAGLWADSDALLKSNLARSHSPYYLMSQLGGNARRLGRSEEALSWYRQAFERSEGPATRLQWGAGYFSALVELAPADAAGIEKLAAQLLGEAARDKGAFHERSARSLQRVGQKLLEWQRLEAAPAAAAQGASGVRTAAVQRLRRQLEGLCPGVEAADGQRATCEALLKPRTAG